MGSQREEQSRKIGSYQDQGDSDREVLELMPERPAALADLGQSAAVDELEHSRQDEHRDGDEQHPGLRLSDRVVERLPLSLPASRIAAPSTSNALPITDPTSVAFTTSCKP